MSLSSKCCNILSSVSFGRVYEYVGMVEVRGGLAKGLGDWGGRMGGGGGGGKQDWIFFWGGGGNWANGAEMLVGYEKW